MSDLIHTLLQLLDDAELYLDLLHATEIPISVGFELKDTQETATMIIEKETIEIVDGMNNPAFKFLLTQDILDKAMNGEVDLLALGGRSKLSDTRPVDFEFIDKDRINESMEVIYRLGVYYLLPGTVKARRMKVELAGSAHGAKPIPLVYWKDLRSAWYHLDKGSILNIEGERDPYPQAFILLNGSGRLVLEDIEIQLIPRTTYYIPRNSMHQVHAEDDLELIWLAWDAPMFS